jgi:GT2 family glycosyltransferase
MDLLEELAWLRFYVPRQTVQLLARTLPLEALRDRLPHVVAERLRFGLYPARITDHKAAEVVCARAYAPWGDPAELDPSTPVRYDAPPRVSILVVTYGNLGLTRLCLASIQRAAGTLPFEVIVVDNASPDASADWLRVVEADQLLPLTLMLNRDNRGFAAGNNQAAARARGDILVFLNNDCVVTPGWLEKLAGHLEHDPRIGLVGPVTNSGGNGEAQLGTYYRDLDGMRRFAADYTRNHDGEVVDVPMLALFCAAVTRARFAEVGGLDERYGLGLFEDDDLAMALLRSGLRVALARDVFVHHYGGAAFSKLPPSKYLRLWWQNRRRFEEKWHTAWQPR